MIVCRAPTTAGQILVVDDVPANLLAAEVALEPLHRTVITATSGAQALACLLEEDFALVLLDVQMPDMDGYETAQWIRARERSRYVPIIFLTAYDRDDASSLRAYELGAVDFILKPIVPEMLRAKAEVLIALQQRAEALARERGERELEDRRRDYETAALRRERDRELARKPGARAPSRGTRRERSAQGRVHRDPRARAAQPARADAHRDRSAARRCAADRAPDRHPRSPGRFADPARRRSAGRRADQREQDLARSAIGSSSSTSSRTRARGVRDRRSRSASMRVVLETTGTPRSRSPAMASACAR